MLKNDKKILIILIALFFLSACSNNNVQNNFSDIQLIELENFNQNIKKNLSVNNIEFLRKNSDSSIRNNKILNEIEKIDFSNLNIFISRVEFEEKNPNSILALNLGENTIYFELIYNYDYHSKKWLIYKVNERR